MMEPMTEFIRKGLEGRSFRATLALYLFGLLVLVLMVAPLVVIRGFDIGFKYAPLIVGVFVVMQYCVAYMPDHATTTVMQPDSSSIIYENGLFYLEKEQEEELPLHQLFQESRTREMAGRFGEAALYRSRIANWGLRNRSFALAISSYKHAIEYPGLDTRLVAALMYNLAAVQMLAGLRDGALETIRQLVESRERYPDLAEQIKSLEDQTHNSGTSRGKKRA